MFEKIVSIHGVPRSGTSWLGQILYSAPNTRYKFQPLFSYAFKDAVNVRSTKEEILSFFKELYYRQDDFLDQTDKVKKGYYPVFENKEKHPSILVTKMVRYHYMLPRFLEEINEFKLIAIIRNPLLVLASWKKSPKEFLPQHNFQEEWRYAPNRNKFKPEEYFGFEKWKESIELFLWLKKKYPKRVIIVNYQDLVEKTIDITKEVFEFTDIKYTLQTDKFIKESKSKKDEDPYSVYKSNIKLNKWRDIIPDNIANKILCEIKNTKYEQFL